MSGCSQCGMWVDPKKPYHPYAACLMFMGCKDGNVVQANLDAVVAYGARGTTFVTPSETISKPAKEYPAWFGAPTLIDRIDESVERGIGLSMAIAECAQWAELRSEAIDQLRAYYALKTKGE